MTVLVFSQAMRKRERLKNLTQQLKDTEAHRDAVHQQLESVRRRRRGSESSAKAARELIQKQALSVVSACRRLEVEPQSPGISVANFKL